MDKKLMVYPFNKRIRAIARYASLLKGYVLTAVVSPKSYGYEGKDISYTDGGNFVGITITASYQDGLDQCDSILFVTSTFSMDIDYYEEKIQNAVNDGKEVLVTKELAEQFGICKKNIPAGVRVLGGNPGKKKISYDEVKSVQEINVPVITIFQVGEYCNSFDTLLLMMERFERDGHQVSKVGSSTLGELFSIHMLPDYLYQPDISYEDKIVSFNYFLNSIVEHEQPDILLLEAAEAILPYSDRITNHFGVIPAMISKAVLADISILNLYYDKYDKKYLDHLRSFCKYALNAEVGYIGIVNETMIVKEMEAEAPVHYVSVGQDRVLHALASDYDNYDCMFFNTYDIDSVDAIYDDIVDKLTQNEEIIRIW